MSDLMLLGVLRIPLDMWPTDKGIFGLRQIQGRCMEAANRIESDEQKIVELEDKIKRLKVALVHAAIPLEILHGQPCKYHCDELNKRISDSVMEIREIICDKNI